MRRKIPFPQEQEKPKTCPLLDRECLKTGCEIFNQRLDRCEIGLTAYNLWLLASVLNKYMDYEDPNTQ